MQSQESLPLVEQSWALNSQVGNQYFYRRSLQLGNTCDVHSTMHRKYELIENDT